jgi:hypothetical protein
MVPVIYTTYGIAMGHRPETLAESGGLRPTGAGRAHERPARITVARARWFKTMLDRVGLRHRDVTGRTEDTGETTWPPGRMLRPSGAAAIAALIRTPTTSTGGDRT